MPASYIPSRSVHGISINPSLTHQFSSFGDDGVVRLWDSRKLVEPLLSLNPEFQNGILSTSWSPDHSMLISCLGRDSPTIKFLYIKETNKESLPHTSPVFSAEEKAEVSGSVTSDKVAFSVSPSPPDFRTSILRPISFRSEETPSSVVAPQSDASATTTSAESGIFMWKIRTIGLDSFVNDFTWIPSSDKENSMFLASVGKESKFEIGFLPAIRNLAFSPSSAIAISQGSRIFIHEAQQESNYTHQDEDISIIMKNRAALGYCLNASKNQEVLSNDDILRKLWKRIDTFSQSSDDSKLRFVGILDIVQGALKGVEGSGKPIASTDRKDSFRRYAIRMCGYDLEDDESYMSRIKSIILSLENAGEYEKAAGIALFLTGSYDLSVRALMNSNDERHRLIAAALTGALASTTSHSSSISWRDISTLLGSELRNPYLRALFGVAASNGDWSFVLNNHQIAIEDRIIVALKFLSNDKVLEFVNLPKNTSFN